MAATLAPALVLVASGAAGSSCRSSPRLEGAPPVVELRLAEFEAVEGFTETRSREGEAVWIAPDAVVDLEDLASALIRRQGDDDFLLLNVKPGSRIRLDAATLAHLEKPVAFMIDGAVVYVPVLRTSIARQVPVRIGRRGITVDEAQRILDAVADQRQFGPRRSAAAPPSAPAPAVTAPAPAVTAPASAAPASPPAPHP